MNPKKRETKSNDQYFVAIRIRGTVGRNPRIEHTLQLLRLPKRYNATLLEKSSEVMGMLRKVKDFITWGEINSGTLDAMIKKRGRMEGNKKISNDFLKEKLGFKSTQELSDSLLNKKITLKKLWESGLKSVFRLHPPKGGFKKSVKRPFKSMGELGYRGEAINKLLEKMV
ncbi:MAG: 50S ribosomal protein L30 [Candidatus Bathyarchaeota archaeon]|nr:50S ribosomal protein L30 [Candidatus Bathyarchaeota archaeon]